MKQRSPNEEVDESTILKIVTLKTPDYAQELEKLQRENRITVANVFSHGDSIVVAYYDHPDNLKMKASA